MYSVILATMLTVGGSSPDWGCRGCCGGCCGGCWGNAFSCYGCGGCWGCYGCCGGCYGCCGGCYGGWSSCYGCCGGCYGCSGGCWGGYYDGYWPGYYGYGSCYGCCGGVVVAAAPGVGVPVAPAAPAAPVLPAAPQKDQKKTAALGNAAAVVLSAPADVQLTVEGQSIARTASEETFRTPELEPGATYTYVFQARVARNGKTTSYTKHVQVRAGQVSEANFTKLIDQGKDTARVTVKLPADARLFVDGVLCPLTSNTRSFDTPDLNVGQKYYYTLKAEVVRQGETRAFSQRVLLEAGKQTSVEFADLPVQTVSR